MEKLTDGFLLSFFPYQKWEIPGQPQIHKEESPGSPQVLGEEVIIAVWVD